MGNDIINWQSARCQTQKLRQRCLVKLFNSAELDYIHNHDSSILAFWHMWSIKETAYKAWQRLVKASPIFNPLAFHCQMISDSECVVSIENLNFKVNSTLNSEFIYSSIISKENTISKVFDSKVLFEDFTNQLDYYGWCFKKDNNGIPSLYSERRSTVLPISISHDQNWFAVQITKQIAETTFEKA
ncbi:MAG: 4'-phosphopantetheinyl transferase superfamily protein [Bacteroidetes bacterium]|nr:4'-phosphopantetheinyl transferase superfamily protein [Bacteroidota bacterium]